MTTLAEKLSTRLQRIMWYSMISAVLNGVMLVLSALAVAPRVIGPPSPLLVWCLLANLVVASPPECFGCCGSRD
jgi:hypothetical protein